MQPFANPWQPEGLDLLVPVDEQVEHLLVDLGAGIAPVDELHLRHQVALVVKQHAVGVAAIAARPPDLLIPRLHRAGDLRMHDEADVLLVDSHAKGVGGQHQFARTAHEGLLHPPPGVTVEVAVVAAMRNAPLAKQRAEAVEHANEREIDDPAARAAVPGTNIEDLPDLLVVSPHLPHREREVRPLDPLVKRRHLVGGEAQLSDDVALHLRSGRGREGHRHRIPEQPAKLPQAGVVGAEVVPPLADAVRLVHGEERDSPRGDDLTKLRLAKPFRRDVEETVASGPHVGISGLTLFSGQRRVDERRIDAAGAEGIDLILHERDQRRDHDRQRGCVAGGMPLRLHHRRHLVAQRLAATGWHDDQRMPARQHVVDDRFLLPTKGVVPEDTGENVGRGHAAHREMITA